MKKLIIIIPIIMFSLIGFNSLHKDRIEKPISWMFRFEDGSSKTFDNSEELKLIELDNQAKTKKRIKSVTISFKTGEIIHVEKKKNVWDRFEVTFDNKTLEVPKEKLKKVNGIYFSSLELLWNGSYEKAFEADYFYVKFDLAENESFGKLPYLQLSFENGKFLKALIWKQVEEKSVQHSNY